MRTLTVPTETEIAQNLGVEPITIVKIEWDSGTIYYSEKTFTLGAINAQGKILTFNPIQAVRKTDVIGEAAGATLLLDDTDGSLKTIINTEVIEGKLVTIYQHFTGNDQADLTILLHGKIAGGIGWSEGERTLDISIDANIEDKEVGFAPDEDDVEDITPDAIDVPWPLCFGTVIHVPAVRVKREPIGHLLEGINQNYDEFEIQGADLFPQEEAVQIVINRILYEGTFSGTTFTATSKNMAHHTNIGFANRPAMDPHFEDGSVAWIDEDTNITGLYCYANTRIGYAVNRCVKQEGRKCFFAEPWGVHTGGIVQYVILGVGEEIEETAGIPRASWGIDFIMETVITPWPIGFFDDIINVVAGAIIIRRGYWSIASGTEVKLKVSYIDLYVCNLLASTEVLAVYGHRKVKNNSVLVPIPSSYYTKDLAMSLAGQTVTALEFATPLEEYENEGWEGDVFVSLRSSIGTNTAYIIKWLVETYSNLIIDDETFDEVATKLGIYPANFAVFDQPNVLKLIEEIAWQARCALVIRNGIVSIIYLSELIAAGITLDESNIELKSLTLGFSETDDIITKLIGNYVVDYSGMKESIRRVVYKNNIDAFNLVEEEREFFIYNNGDLVKLSTYFWGYRYSNSWRKAAFKTFLDTLAFEPFDTIEHDIAILSTNTVRGIIEDTSHDSDEHSITIKTELASKAGDADSGQPIEDQGYWLGDPVFPVDPWNNPLVIPDPGENLEEKDYSVPTPTDDGQDGDTGGGQTVPPPVSQMALIITEQPEVVNRGVAFNFCVKIVDAQGELVNESAIATLFLSLSTDDVLTPTTINIIGGTYQGQLTITTGTGQQPGIITVVASGYQPDATAQFTIVDIRTDLVVYPIPNIVREVAQDTLQVLSDGVEDDIIHIYLNTTTTDKIYDSAGDVITTLTADALGDFYLPANWYIAGGQGSVTGAEMAFKDRTQLLYADAISDPFNITGATTLVITQEITLLQDESDNANTVEIIVPEYIADDAPFALTINILDSNDDVDTTFNGTVYLDLLDHLGVTLLGLNWISAGDDAQIFGSQMWVPIINGTWSYDECIIEIPDTEELIYIAAQEATNEDLYNIIAVNVNEPFFSIAINAGVMLRDTSYNMTVTARKGDGTVDTDYLPIQDPTIILDGDLLDEITPALMGKTGWVAGVKTIAFSITGGAGTDETELTVEELNRCGRTEIVVISNGTPTLIPLYAANRRCYYGNGWYLESPVDSPCGESGFQSFLNIQAEAKAALRADNTLSTESPYAGWTLGSYPGPVTINISNFLTILRLKYTLTPDQIADTKGAFLRTYLYGSVKKILENWSLFEYAHLCGMKMDFDYAGTKYLTGDAAYIASMPLAWNYAELNDKFIAVGGVPGSVNTVWDIPVPTAWINGITGTDIYLWIATMIPGNIPNDLAWCANQFYIRTRLELLQLGLLE